MILLEKSTKVTITTKHKDRYENISHHYISAAFALLTLGFGSVCMAHAEVNSSSTQQVNGLSSGAQTEENKDENLLDQIPRWIDATPTIFPEQSNEPIVPPTEQTEDQTWFDRKQKKIRNWADRTSGKIDNWFGEVDPQNLHQPPFGS